MKYEAACSDWTWQNFEMLRYSASREAQILLTTVEEGKAKKVHNRSIEQQAISPLPLLLLHPDSSSINHHHRH